MEEISRKYQSLFLVGAAFNAVVSATLAAPKIFFPLLDITPIPDEPNIFLDIALGAIGIFGVGYFMASQDFPRHSNLIELAVVSKLGVNAVGAVHVFYHQTISWQVFFVLFWDLIFAALFIQALLDLYAVEKKVKAN